MRRAAQITVSVVVAVLALLTAAYAATGQMPLAGTLIGGQQQTAHLDAGRPTGALRALGGPTVLFNVSRLVPGSIKTGQITITNTASTGGPVTFTPSQLQDAPTGLAEPLSSVIDFVVQDTTNRFLPVTLYSGKLATVGQIALGRFAAGEARTYRFTATFPVGRSDTLDNPLQGAGSQIVFDWDAVLDDPPPPTTPTTPTTTTTTTTTTATTTSTGGTTTLTQPVAPTGRPGSRTATTNQPAAPARLRLAWRSAKRGGGLSAEVYCREACSGSLKGIVRVKSRKGTVSLRGHAVKQRKGVRRVYVLRMPRRPPAGLAKAIRARKAFVANVTLSVRVKAGRVNVLQSAVSKARR